MQESELAHLLNNRFNLSDLKGLCFDLNLDYEDLPGAAKSEKVRQLVDYFRRRGQLPLLLKAISHQRRDIQFTSEDFAQAAAVVVEDDDPADAEWLQETAATQDQKESQRQVVLALLDKDNLPAGLKAALRFLVENA